ncbi:UDP-glycosyltransferase 73B1-like [Camellia sinensis]|uniref:UDP-glycosyltransferase 73B1-like n=1 Tax=Camellia sinensis TaxID=4442 RepID=UPI001035553C|nr:UDP-glycosyltransferase 73B1-like [Camellia sinensis]
MNLPNERRYKDRRSQIGDWKSGNPPDSYAQLFQKPIEGDQSLGHDISFHTFKLPTGEFGLPDGCENLLHGSVGKMEKIYLAVEKLQEPIQNSSENAAPIASFFCSRSVVKRTFGGTHRTIRQIVIQRPFALPGLPDDNLIFTKKKTPFWFKDKGTGWGQFLDMVIESELRSYGVMVNSFYDMEPAYAEYFKDEMGRKLWLLGPVFLFNNEVEQKAERGQKNSIEGGTVLNWLDSKGTKSVLYVSFGSLVSMHPEQFLELAHGLEASSCPFIWVARDESEFGQEKEAEMETGIRVGNEEWLSYTWEPKVTVTREKVKAAVKWLLGGGGVGEVEEVRRRAKELSVKAKKAVNHGGSSDADVVSFDQ